MPYYTDAELGRLIALETRAMDKTVTRQTRQKVIDPGGGDSGTTYQDGDSFLCRIAPLGGAKEQVQSLVQQGRALFAMTYPLTVTVNLTDRIKDGSTVYEVIEVFEPSSIAPVVRRAVLGRVR